MILIISPNAALDYYVESDACIFGKTNRVKNTNIVVGGKGINIAKSFKKLQQECKLLTFLSGFTGNYIKDFLNQEKIDFDFVECENQNTRINFKLKTSSEETEFNGVGVNLSKTEFDNFINLFKQTIRTQNVEHVILSGTNAIYDQNLFEVIAKLCNEQHIEFSLDANNNDILELAKYKPFLIKPNIDEFNDLFKTSIKWNEYALIKDKMKHLQTLGIKNILLSMGENGAIFANNSEFNHSSIKVANFISTVAAGDTMLSGFLYKYINTKEFTTSFEFSIMLSSKKITQLDFVSEKQAYTFANKLERIL